jgi:hypothetical protein
MQAIALPAVLSIQPPVRGDGGNDENSTVALAEESRNGLPL